MCCRVLYSFDAIAEITSSYYMKTSRLEKEANIRKKLEEALKDAQRAIADKEALLQDARNEAAQRENAHIETKQDRDGLLATLTRTRQTLEVEMAAKDELQNLANELKEKFHFQQQLSEKVNHHDKKKDSGTDRKYNVLFYLLMHCCVCYPYKVLTARCKVIRGIPCQCNLSSEFLQLSSGFPKPRNPDSTSKNSIWGNTHAY